MTTQAARPIAIQTSPIHSRHVSTSEPTYASAQDAASSLSESPRSSYRVGSLSNRPELGDGSRRPVHGRRMSRFEALTELLLPEPVMSASATNESGKSFETAASRRYSLEANKLQTQQAEVLRQNLSQLIVAQLLALDATVVKKPLIIHQGASIEATCELFCTAMDTQPILVMRDRHVEGPIDSEAICGLLSHQDINVFLSLAFGPSSDEDSAKARELQPNLGLSSPPLSPNGPIATSFGDASKSNFKTKGPSRHARRKDVLDRIKANEIITAGMVMGLGGDSTAKIVTPETSMHTVLQMMISDGFLDVLVVYRRDRPLSELVGMISTARVVQLLVQENSSLPAFAALMDERLDDLAVMHLLQPSVTISGEKTVIDALSLMRLENVASLAVLDGRGGLLSGLSSAEIAREVMRSKSKRILTTPLKGLVKSLRSQHPEGLDGKDSHPAISVGLSSCMGRAAALLLATSASGIYVLDDLTPAMTPPLSTVSPSSPAREFSSWSLTGDGPFDEGGSSTRPLQHRRSSTSFWTSPRIRAATQQGLPLAGMFSDSSEGGGGGAHEVSSSLSASMSSMSSIPTSSRGASTVRTHRPRSMSLAQPVRGERVAPVRWDSGGRVVLPAGETPAGVARSSSIHGHDSRTGSGTSTGTTASTGSGAISGLAVPRTSSQTSLTLSCSPSSSHGSMVGGCAMPDPVPLSPPRFCLDYAAVLRHIALGAGLARADYC